MKTVLGLCLFLRSVQKKKQKHSKQLSSYSKPNSILQSFEKNESFFSGTEPEKKCLLR